jgi:subtilisin family serine protease
VSGRPSGRGLGLALGLACLSLVCALHARDWRTGDAPDTVVVQWRRGPDAAALAAEAARLGLGSGLGEAELHKALHKMAGAELKRSLDLIKVDIVRLPGAVGAAAVDRALAVYRASGLVATAGPDGPMRMAQAPSSYPPTDLDLAGGQQNLTDTAWMGAAAAYSAGTIKLQGQVTVALLDTGVNPGPPADTEFSQGQVLPDGVSYVEGVFSSADDNGHGTFCAGLLAAFPQNPSSPSGIYGTFLDPSLIRILPVKVLDSCGRGYTSNLTSGVVYAVGQGARVISMSIAVDEDDPALQSACEAARDAEVFLVAAAGNDAGATSYPAAYAQVLAVAALDHADMPASYSNSGKIDISAPGGDGLSPGYCPCNGPPANASAAQALVASCPYAIWSLATDYPGCPSDSPPNLACGLSLAYGYAAGSGTSFACPQVAAAAALLFSQDPGRQVSDVQQLLLRSAAATALGPGYNNRTGWGKLNLLGALVQTHAGAPASPLKVYNWPNPFSPAKDGLTTLTFFLPQPAAATLSVYDGAGELVRHWDLGAASTYAGMNQLTWDGRNGRGTMAANGAYLLVLQSGGARAVNRIGLLQ